jgi:hypothetical protein
MINKGYQPTGETKPTNPPNCGSSVGPNTRHLTVYGIGEECQLCYGADIVVAQITAVTIYEDGVSYRCVWWDGRMRCEQWVAACEIRPDKNTYARPIGFMQGNYREPVVPPPPNVDTIPIA